AGLPRRDVDREDERPEAGGLHTIDQRLGPCRSRQTYSWNHREPRGSTAIRSSGDVVPIVDSAYGILDRVLTTDGPFSSLMHHPRETGGSQDERDGGFLAQDRRRRRDARDVPERPRMELHASEGPARTSHRQLIAGAAV